MKLAVNHMVCPRCIEAVEGILAEIGVHNPEVQLGEVRLDRQLSEMELDIFKKRLDARGFELVFDRETELINLVKKSLIDYLKMLEEKDQPKTLSAFIAAATHYNYSYLSKLFSDHEGRTIESYLIDMKIERVKELLGFRKYTLSEIAWKLKYSSVQYLSNQFKKNTGYTVSEYLKMNRPDRKTLDQI